MISIAATQRGMVINKDVLISKIGHNTYKELLEHLTIKKSQRVGKRINTKTEFLYKHVKGVDKMYLIVSRFSIGDVRKFLLNYNIKCKLINKIPEGDDISYKYLRPGPTLDPNQCIISDYLDKNVYNDRMLSLGVAGSVLVLPTGLGKTYIACSKIRDFGKKTLVVVPNSTILAGWKEVLSKCYPKLIVGEYSSKRKKDGDVVVMIINSAKCDRFIFRDGKKVDNILCGEYFKKFGCVIYDEIHNYTAAGGQTALWRTNFKYALGLTATPDENSWDMDIIFQKHCGKLIDALQIPGYNPDMIKWLGSVQPIYYLGPPEYTQKITNPGNDWTSHGEMVAQFCADVYRNKVLLDIICDLYYKGRNIFVFFKNREFSKTLQNMLTSRLGFELDERAEFTILMGGAKTADHAAAKTSKIVLTTYHFGAEGVSIPKMDTLVFATPRMAKMKQIIGRILRKSGDPDIKRLIIDIVDKKTEIGQKQFTKRKKTYMNKVLYDFDIKDPIIKDYEKVNIA